MTDPLERAREIVATIGPDMKERFWERVSVRDPEECWEWTGGKTNGYGTFCITTGYRQRTNVRAHRVAYLLAKGPITDGLFVCHACDNRLCVNPSHLWLGTSKDNMHDCATKGRIVRPKRNEDEVRRYRGTSHIRSKLSLDDIQLILSSTFSHTDLAGMLGVSRRTVSWVRKGRSYRDEIAQLREQKA